MILNKWVFIYLYVCTDCYCVTFIDVDCNDIIMILIKSDKIVKVKKELAFAYPNHGSMLANLNQYCMILQA
jgi:hypothetical protein